jgi:hypothetical protein
MKIENTVIDGKKICVQRQGLRRRIKAKAVLASIVGPAIAKALSPIMKKATSEGSSFDIKSLKDFNLESLATLDIGEQIIPALEGVVSTIDEDKLLKLIDTLMVGVSVNEADVSDHDKFDAVFDDCMGTMYKVCAFALRVNFSDLMSDLGTLIGLPDEEEEKEQTEQKDSGNS